MTLVFHLLGKEGSPHLKTHANMICGRNSSKQQHHLDGLECVQVTVLDDLSNRVARKLSPAERRIKKSRGAPSHENQLSTGPTFTQNGSDAITTRISNTIRPCRRPAWRAYEIQTSSGSGALQLAQTASCHAPELSIRILIQIGAEHFRVVAILDGIPKGKLDLEAALRIRDLTVGLPSLQPTFGESGKSTVRISLQIGAIFASSSLFWTAVQNAISPGLGSTLDFPEGAPAGSCPFPISSGSQRCRFDRTGS